MLDLGHEQVCAQAVNCYHSQIMVSSSDVEFFTIMLYCLKILSPHMVSKRSVLHSVSGHCHKAQATQVLVVRSFWRVSAPTYPNQGSEEICKRKVQNTLVVEKRKLERCRLCGSQSVHETASSQTA